MPIRKLTFKEIKSLKKDEEVLIDEKSYKFKKVFVSKGVWLYEFSAIKPTSSGKSFIKETLAIPMSEITSGKQEIYKETANSVDFILGDK